MGFPRISQRSRPTERWSGDPADILWGVDRREGCSTIDDPRAHRGRTQHAYVAGFDDQALCGHNPTGWLARQDVPLAMPTELNPQCQKCRVALRESPNPRPMMLPAIVLAPVPVAAPDDTPWPAADLRAAFARGTSSDRSSGQPAQAAHRAQQPVQHDGLTDTIFRVGAGAIGKVAATSTGTKPARRSRAKT